MLPISEISRVDAVWFFQNLEHHNRNENLLQITVQARSLLLIPCIDSGKTVGEREGPGLSTSCISWMSARCHP